MARAAAKAKKPDARTKPTRAVAPKKEKQAKPGIREGEPTQRGARAKGRNTADAPRSPPIVAPVQPAATKEPIVYGGGRSGGKTEKAKKAPVSLPKSLVDTAPAALIVLEHLRGIDKGMMELADQLRAASNKGSTQLSRAFVVLHALQGSFEERSKILNAMFAVYKTSVVPGVFENEGVPHVALAEGFRVGTSMTSFTSMVSDQKEEAMKWLRNNDYADIIQETVNSSTLSALARNLREEQNIDLPEQFFTTKDVANTSVTRTGK